MSNFRFWLHRRFANFVAFSMLAVGLPMYGLISLLRNESATPWTRVLDVFLGVWCGFTWATVMWCLVVRDKAKQIREEEELLR